MTPRRTFALLLNAALPLGAAVALAVPAYTWEAPDAGWHGIDQVDRSKVPANIPTWTPALQRQFPAFQAIADLAGQVPSQVIAVDLFAEPRVMDFQTAWDRTHDDTRANDVWVVGGRS